MSSPDQFLPPMPAAAFGVAGPAEANAECGSAVQTTTVQLANQDGSDVNGNDDTYDSLVSATIEPIASAFVDGLSQQAPAGVWPQTTESGAAASATFSASGRVLAPTAFEEQQEMVQRQMWDQHVTQQAEQVPLISNGNAVAAPPAQDAEAAEVSQPWLQHTVAGSSIAEAPSAESSFELLSAAELDAIVNAAVAEAQQQSNIQQHQSPLHQDSAEAPPEQPAQPADAESASFAAPNNSEVAAAASVVPAEFVVLPQLIECVEPVAPAEESFLEPAPMVLAANTKYTLAIDAVAASQMVSTAAPAVTSEPASSATALPGFAAQKVLPRGTEHTAVPAKRASTAAIGPTASRARRVLVPLPQPTAAPVLVAAPAPNPAATTAAVNQPAASIKPTAVKQKPIAPAASAPRTIGAADAPAVEKPPAALPTSSAAGVVNARQPAVTAASAKAKFAALGAAKRTMTVPQQPASAAAGASVDAATVKVQDQVSSKATAQAAAPAASTKAIMPPSKELVSAAAAAPASSTGAPTNTKVSGAVIPAATSSATAVDGAPVPAPVAKPVLPGFAAPTATSTIASKAAVDKFKQRAAAALAAKVAGAAPVRGPTAAAETAQATKPISAPAAVPAVTPSKSKAITAASTTATIATKTPTRAIAASAAAKAIVAPPVAPAAVVTRAKSPMLRAKTPTFRPVAAAAPSTASAPVAHAVPSSAAIHPAPFLPFQRPVASAASLSSPAPASPPAHMNKVHVPYAPQPDWIATAQFLNRFDQGLRDMSLPSTSTATTPGGTKGITESKAFNFASDARAAERKARRQSTLGTSADSATGEDQAEAGMVQPTRAASVIRGRSASAMKTGRLDSAGGASKRSFSRVQAHIDAHGAQLPSALEAVEAFALSTTVRTPGKQITPSNSNTVAAAAAGPMHKPGEIPDAVRRAGELAKAEQHLHASGAPAEADTAAMGKENSGAQLASKLGFFRNVLNRVKGTSGGAALAASSADGAENAIAAAQFKAFVPVATKPISPKLHTRRRSLERAQLHSGPVGL